MLSIGCGYNYRFNERTNGGRKQEALRAWPWVIKRNSAGSPPPAVQGGGAHHPPRQCGTKCQQQPTWPVVGLIVMMDLWKEKDREDKEEQNVGRGWRWHVGPLRVINVGFQIFSCCNARAFVLVMINCNCFNDWDYSLIVFNEVSDPYWVCEWIVTLA